MFVISQAKYSTYNTEVPRHTENMEWNIVEWIDNKKRLIHLLLWKILCETFSFSFSMALDPHLSLPRTELLWLLLLL